MTAPLVTISVVSHGDAAKIARLLESIQIHEPNIARVQLILTDNLGNELPEFESARWESVKILRNKKTQGFAYNHNRAFESARGEYFVVMNPDLVFESAILETLLNTLHTHHADLVAPQIVDAHGTVQDSFRPLPSPFELIRRRLPGYRFEIPQPDANGLIHPDWIAAMFWLMPSSTYRALRGMDEKFKLYFEDVEFCTRARLQGLKIIVDARQRVRHDAQRSSRKSLYYLSLHIRSALSFFVSPLYRQARRQKG